MGYYKKTGADGRVHRGFVAETLADHFRLWPYWEVHCQCGRSEPLDPEALIAVRGGEFPMARLRAIVKCDGCGAKGPPAVRVQVRSDGRPQ